jgi:hypothetical protein
MGMTRLLVALYPPKWRATFGEEFAALLEDTRLTPRVIADVVVSAGKLHAASHRKLSFILTSLLWSALMEYLSKHAHLAVNALWIPRTPASALALAATVAPWLWLAAVITAQRLGRRRENALRGTSQ